MHSNYFFSLFVFDPISVIEIDEVLEAKIVSGLHILSSF